MSYPLLAQRLTIQPLTEKDLLDFVSYRQDPDIARYQSWDTNYSKEQAMALIESQTVVLIPAKGNWLQLAVHDSESKELLGDLALHSLSDDEFEIGFTIAKKHQGKGFAKEAVTTLIDHLFQEIGAIRVIANTDSRNTPSISVLKALGFVQDPSKSWVELFKNEMVTVDYFELNSSQQKTKFA
jgi:RimJ/RimL family protein N-acetyltransferase